MKKLIFSMIAMIGLTIAASCCSNSANTSTSVDSTSVDTIVVDTVA